MKRGRGSLTGGTGDVNPQQYNIVLVQPGADLTDILTLPVPVYRFPLSKGRAMVMEMLKIDWIIEDFVAGASQASIAAGISTSQVGSLTNGGSSTQANQFNAMALPTTLACFSYDYLFATGAGFAITSRIQERDYTDAAGHGVLIATDQITVFLASTNTAISNRVVAKMLYRWKEVSLEEYIGIVQSQQNPN